MNAKSAREPVSTTEAAGMPAWPSAQGLCGAATDALRTSQRLLEFVEQAQALQFALLRSWGASMQSALEAAERARHPVDLVAAQSGLANAIAVEAVNCQAGMMRGWQALQEELAPDCWPRPPVAIEPLPGPGAAPAFAMAGLDAAFEEARKGFEAATRGWAAVLARLQAPPVA